MTIKHLVISGGGSIGFQFIGALKYLNENNYWNIETIKSIYSTSVGSIIGVFLCLKYDWDTILTYIIERPWQDLFKLSGKQIIDAYINKGLYNKKIIDIVFKPLLEAKDLSLNITLKEFYEYSNIELFIYTFELNSFKTIEVSFHTYPDLSLMTAISMSCAVPGIFMPIIEENKCFIDGGVMANYPLSHCLQNHNLIDKKEILGLKYNIDEKNFNGCNITKDSTILDYILAFSSNAMNFITNSSKCETIINELIFTIDESPLSIHYIKKTIKSLEMRQSFLEQGYKVAEDYLNINKSS